MTISRSDAERIVRIAAAIIVDERGQTLLVRKRGTETFMQAGGKLGGNENAAAALQRELREELGCDMLSCRSLGLFRAPAANEPGWMVEAELFAADVAGKLQASGEIEQVLWCDPDDIEDLTLAPLTRDHVLPMVRAAREYGGLNP
ncbi:MAG: 8-oxo-dGTP diphosphatase [Sphingomonadales bacterium]|jgi:8-oxo-dGTP diphosphatase|nr:8-oxo-dGTP diphosphatase [Sphingomonadales bacterium]